MADRHDFVLEAMRSSNPRPAGTAGPSAEWTPQELLSAIEAGRSGMDTIKERTTTTVQPQGPNRRGWLVAAAAFVAVVLIGATLLALRPAPSPDVVEPLPTTTVPTPTTATPTTIAATTTTTTASPTTTLPPRVPQTFEAAVVWDGETCTLDGPAEIYARDTLDFTYTNTSSDVVDFMIVYLTTGHTPADLVPYNGDIDVTDPSAARASFAMLVDTAPGSTGFGTLQPGESADKELIVKAAREHVVICLGGPQPPGADNQFAVASTTGIAVTR